MRKIFGLTALALAVGFASCSKDNTLENGGGTEAGTIVAFTFNKPQGSFVTYADIASTEEWYIDAIDVYAAVGGTVSKLGSADYAMTESAKTYTITMDKAWVTANAGQSANFYFVGNDAISTEGAHDDLALTAEADFKNALADALQDSGSGKYNTIVKPNGSTTGLLFSTYIENVKVDGKVNKSATLTRREARFDLENPMFAGDAFEVTEILVSDASTSGLIFGAGDPATVAIAKESHVSIAGFQEAAYDANGLATSIFYLYPTEMGTGLTEITIMGSFGGDPAQAYTVDASNVSNKIEANTRYILVLDEATVTFRIEVADYDEGGKLPATPGEDGTVTLENFGGTDLTGFVEATRVYTFSATTGNTLTFDVTTKYGTEAVVDYVFGGVPSTDIGGLTPVTTTTYVGYQTVDCYSITVPADANDGFYIRVDITAKQGDAKQSIIFTKGALNLVDLLGGNTALADAIKTIIEENGGDVNNITPADLAAVTKINIATAIEACKALTSLEVFEVFPNLTSLTLWNLEDLTTADLSKFSELYEITLQGASISSLDISQNKKLRRLFLMETTLPKIDLQSESLRVLYFGGSPNLDSNDKIDLSGMPNLDSLSMWRGGTPIKDICWPHSNLSYFQYYGSQASNHSTGENETFDSDMMETLDVSVWPNLKILEIRYVEKLHTVNGLDNHQNIEFIAMRYNENESVKSFSISGAPNLKQFYRSHNPYLESLSINDCPSLDRLEIQDNPLLTSVDLGNTNTLTYINVSRSAITNLNIRNNPGITTMGVRDLPSGTINLHVWNGFNTSNPRAHFSTYSIASLLGNADTNVTFTGHDVE